MVESSGEGRVRVIWACGGTYDCCPVAGGVRVQLHQSRAGGDVPAVTSDNRLSQLLDKYDIARNGNGHDEELSEDQFHLIQTLYDRVKPHRQALRPEDQNFCDLETCRRYLVARQWDLQKAEDQLASTLIWRKETEPNKLEFWQSPKSLANPHALSLRIVGWDAEGRVIGYTCFAEALDRWDVEANMTHLSLLLEAGAKMLRERRARGLNKTADSRQTVWIVDFDGFKLKDQDPRSAIGTAHLLQHHPELLHLIVLLNAPTLFAGIYRLITPLLDERVRSKIMFVNGQKNFEDVLKTRLGLEAAHWIAAETDDNKIKRKEAKIMGNPKKYWIPPSDPGQHDPRGIASYVNSDLYIKTPGDAFEERKRQGSSEV